MVIRYVPNTPEPSLAVARAVIVPLETAVTIPIAFILAIPELSTNDQVTVFTVALAGRIVADS